MSDAFWIALFAMVGPILTIIVSHYWSGKKLDKITELANSTLSHTVAKKDEAEKRLEENLLTQLAASRQEVAALKEKVALLTPPPKKD